MGNGRTPRHMYIRWCSEKIILNLGSSGLLRHISHIGVTFLINSILSEEKMRTVPNGENLPLLGGGMLNVYVI